MAIGTPIDRGTAERNYGSATMVSSTFTPAADSLLIAVMMYNQASFTASGITGHDGGTSWGQYLTTQSYSGDSTSIWLAHSGSSPSSGAITVSAAGSPRGVVCFAEVNGVDVSGTLANSFIQNDSGASYAGSISATLSGSSDMTMFLIGTRDFGSGSVEGGWTELNQIQNANTNVETTIAYIATGDDTPTYTLGDTQAFGFIVGELRAAAAAGEPLSSFYTQPTRIIKSRHI